MSRTADGRLTSRLLPQFALETNLYLLWQATLPNALESLRLVETMFKAEA